VHLPTLGGEMRTRDDLLEQIRAERAQWQDLVTEIGPERMGRPGPMGDWTFKDLAAHLTGWRARTIARIKAGPGREPASAWPAHLTEDNEINQWIYERSRAQSLDEVLSDADQSFEDLAEAISALSDEDLTVPGRFAWTDDRALVDVPFFGHFHEGHEPSLRAWMEAR
jgi:uncharacterized protein (TIGR03083 family)